MQPCVAVAVVWGEGGGTDRLQALDDLLHVHELAVVGLKGELDLRHVGGSPEPLPLAVPQECSMVMVMEMVIEA